MEFVSSQVLKSKTKNSLLTLRRVQKYQLSRQNINKCCGESRYSYYNLLEKSVSKSFMLSSTVSENDKSENKLTSAVGETIVSDLAPFTLSADHKWFTRALSTELLTRFTCSSLWVTFTRKCTVIEMCGQRKHTLCAETGWVFFHVEEHSRALFLEVTWQIDGLWYFVVAVETASFSSIVAGFVLRDQ